jgi:hypothetical protein
VHLVFFAFVVGATLFAGRQGVFFVFGSRMGVVSFNVAWLLVIEGLALYLLLFRRHLSGLILLGMILGVALLTFFAKFVARFSAEEPWKDEVLNLKWSELLLLQALLLLFVYGYRHRRSLRYPPL